MTPEGSVVGVTKGNAALLEGVNRAIAAAKEDGSMDQYVADGQRAGFRRHHRGPGGRNDGDGCVE